MPSRVPAAWMRNASDELAVRKGCYFDEPAGQFVCDFLEQFCCLSEGDWAGKPFVLIPWERDLVMRLYGWKRPDGRRRFRRCYCEIAKKNGKSPLISGLSNYHLIADGEGGPKVYLNACDREQARIVFEHASGMVDQSPELKARLEVVDSRNRIVWREGRGVIIANSAVVDSKDGRNASLVVFDELHRLPDRKLWRVFKYAGASRRQPLTISITTAGESEEGVWFDQREYSESVNAGKTPDITHLGVIYRADRSDDVDDPKTWEKANPSLGHTIEYESFKLDLEEAKQTPVDWNEFLRLRLNIIAQADAKHFDMEKWAACRATTPLALEDLRGWRVFMGLDLSNIHDLTALAILARKDGRYRLVTKFWCPEGNLLQLERRTRQPYRMWAEKGYLVPTPGDTVDYKFIRKAVNEAAEKAGLAKLGADPWHADKLLIELEQDDGLPVEMVRQGYKTLSNPTKEFTRLIDAGLIEHDGNPVMDWCVSNAVAMKDENECIRLTKKKSRQKIDGASAAVNATAVSIVDDCETGDSVYNSRGILTL